MSFSKGIRAPGRADAAGAEATPPSSGVGGSGGASAFARSVGDAELDAAVAQYRAQGWAVVPNVASEATLEALRRRASEICAVDDSGLFYQPEGATGRYDDVAKVPGWVGRGWYRKIEKLEKDSLFRAWLANDVFARIVGRVIPGAVTLYRAVLFTKAPRIGSDTPWHQDGGRLWGLDRDPELQLWTALDDAPIEAGCLEVVPGSHHALATDLGGVVPAAMTANVKVHAVPARAGDVVLLHNLTWHRAGPNTTDQVRRAFTACYLAEGTRCVRRRKTGRVFERVW